MINLLKKNILSIVTALVILWLSLASASSFSKVNTFGIPHADKIVHVCMYFGLMTVLLFENRFSLKNKKVIYFLAAGSLAYGILMEILQWLFTTSRTGDIVDALFDLAGILISISGWLLFFKRNDITVK